MAMVTVTVDMVTISVVMVIAMATVMVLMVLMVVHMMNTFFKGQSNKGHTSITY